MSENSGLYSTLLICPSCKGKLKVGKQTLQCLACEIEYREYQGVPILINDAHSFLKTQEIIDAAAGSFPRMNDKFKFLRAMHRLFWRLSFKVIPHLYSKRRMIEIADIFIEYIEQYKESSKFPQYRLLIVGGGNLGNIGREINTRAKCELINSDVYFTSAVNLIADITSLPFENSCFDFVLAEGVLEHVISPAKGVEEIHRVLKPGGISFITSPLMLGVHMPAADFTRWTKSGLVSLFRNFENLESGVIDGAFIALAYQLSYIAMVLSPKRILKFVNLFINLILFPLKFLDSLFRRAPLVEDVACSLYMIARKSDTITQDGQIIDSFTGAGYCPY